MTDLMMTRAQMAEAIADLPSVRGVADGWFHQGNLEAYRELAERMVLAGMSPRRAYDVLSSAYGIVSSEYGN